MAAGDNLAGGTYTPSFTFTGLSGVRDYTQLVLLKRPDAASNWALVGTHVPTTGSNAAPVLSRTGVTGFSDFTAGGDANVNPLPVELVSFTAQAQGRVVALTWRTASEKNSSRFEVERSANGSDFERIATVAAAGSSPNAQAYAYTDSQLLSGVTLLYYRLHQLDLDGQAAYSPVRSVAIASPPAGLTVFPNPATRAATLAGALPGTRVLVLDALGRTVLTATVDAAGTAALVLPDGLASGIYVVRAGTQAQQLVIE
ncbi:T9SS type A sorting domain-containing protein [Hymenobacter sp. BRD67]|uniref:T9SS type A sorting domain-containing protein n=1 Tax=Hymenobacter sp. BRD67 TaxID=2675877 RepID=UPI001563E41C|nr:T9SS type A sorting domain-containing protein [Hymenobacter sp. BRD67]QKG53345.1 T9SS type A sorting domain-containing protein [Hymenobacter sp. BRD67]